MVEIWGFLQISALNLRMKVELFSHPWFLPYLLRGSKDIWIMEGLRRSLIFVYLFWRSLHRKGTKWNASLLSQPNYLFWFLWVFFVNLGSFFAPVDNMVIKSMNSPIQCFYCLLIMIMTFTTNAHMLLISPAQQWIYFMQNAACFHRDHRGNWFVHNKCLCLSEKTERTSQKNRRSCVCAMCWWLLICITHSTTKL